MPDILVLGGTKFLGADFVKSLDPILYNISIASRRKPGGTCTYYNIDRKREEDLILLLSAKRFEIIVDFIGYSMPDARKLIHSITRQNNYSPFVVVISSTYVYGNPLELETNGEYNESCFDPFNYEYSELDRPMADYFIGKRSMESFIVKNYDNYAIIRFPIILGANDNTVKTGYFLEIIKSKKKIRFDDDFGSSNFIFSKEAADFLNCIISRRGRGIFNCCLDERLNQLHILSQYCQYFNISVDDVLSTNSNMPFTRSPFFYRRDFLINNDKQKAMLDFNSSFRELLFRELKVMVSNG